MKWLANGGFCRCDEPPHPQVWGDECGDTSLRAAVQHALHNLTTEQLLRGMKAFEIGPHGCSCHCFLGFVGFGNYLEGCNAVGALGIDHLLGGVFETHFEYVKHEAVRELAERGVFPEVNPLLEGAQA